LLFSTSLFILFFYRTLQSDPPLLLSILSSVHPFPAVQLKGKGNGRKRKEEVKSEIMRMDEKKW
jgi:hypothetical protein